MDEIDDWLKQTELFYFHEAVRENTKGTYDNQNIELISLFYIYSKI